MFFFYGCWFVAKNTILHVYFKYSFCVPDGARNFALLCINLSLIYFLVQAQYKYSFLVLVYILMANKQFQSVSH